MDSKKENRFSPPAMGGVSLLVVFAVLCLTIFALLSLTTVQADVRLADSSAQAVADYYKADCAAQEILARLRAGEMPEGVERNGDIYTYACSISSARELEVQVRLEGTSYTVLRWQADFTEDWNYDDSLKLWDGQIF